MALIHRRQPSVAALVAVAATVAAAVCWSGTWAQPTGSSCAPALVSLMPCLSYVSGNSSAPSSQCCSQLSTVVKSNAQCLCTLLSRATPLPFTVPINQTQALTLPGACKIQTPPLSQCSAVAAPAPVGSGASAPPTPVGAPEPSSPLAPKTAASPKSSLPNMPSGNGSKATPATSGQSSAASSAKFTHPLLLLLFTSSCASVLFSIRM